MARPSPLFRLTSATARSRETIGGKACGLVRLMRAGLSVPDAWVLPVHQLEDWCEHEPDGQLALTAAGALELEKAWDELIVGPLAVRSSAAAEDLADASYAGVYETVLGVDGAEALCSAVRHCLRAFGAQRVDAYERGRGPRGSRVGALIMQAMVPAERAGVLMTANPQRPFAHEIVVEAASGLGELVVSGQVQPDHVVLCAKTGTVLRRRGARSLSERDLRQIFDVAKRIETRFGARQDLEFAIAEDRVWWLQLRPMTGLPPAQPNNVWSRRFGDEYLAEVSTPLGHTLLGGLIEDVFLRDFAERFGFADALEHPPLRRHDGYAFISGEYVTALVSALPRRWRRMAGLDWFGPVWNERIASEPFRPRRLLGIVRTTRRDRLARLGANPQALDDHCRRIVAEVAPLLEQDYDELSNDVWEGQLKAALALGEVHFRIIRWGMGFFNPGLHGLLQGLLARWCADADGALYADLIGGLAGTHTTRINRRVWQLAELARQDAALAEAIVAGRIYSELRDAAPGGPFWVEFHQFMVEFGHRSESREISEPRWVETPNVVLGLVRAQLRADGIDDPTHAQERAAQRQRRARGEAVRRIRSARLRFGERLKGRVLGRVIDQTLIYTRYRENQRFFLDYLLAHIRFLVLAAGRELVGRGSLADVQDVFLLERAELLALRRGLSGPAGSVIEVRRAELARGHRRRPATFLFDGVETEGDVAQGCGGAEGTGEGAPGDIRGMGVSAGEVSGRVRVVRRIQDLASVEPGEILVASTTDPAWTSVFPFIGGLVTETGGMLSHGAVLAREYGIPAVTGVANVLDLLEDGETVSLCGAMGRVWRDGG